MIVYLLGVDGAGKTTLAKKLLAATWPRVARTRYIYCQHRPILLWLFKLPARLLWLHGTDREADYAEYTRRKALASTQRQRLASAYALLWRLDAWLQTWPRVTWARLTSDLVIVDRYYLDWAVNLCVLRDKQPADVTSEAQALERFLPPAQLHLFLDLPEDVALGRKNDIPSKRYLSERRPYYEELARARSFTVIDATQSPEAVAMAAITAVQKAMSSHRTMRPEQRPRSK